ncbi:N-acetylmuramoyl-L-alanine amidase [Clostridium aestuarii]|uniref:N-acetylmuramoyl-L-alanine amidase n=1 Tax=Clostridium aestuarii TaxID=338193 RepID=A0ABT4D6V2_9CLOT|nr:N-acetylmuramoyl-L-alanine amidase [Clostridium aestuarii]MCY6485915.1 N-acetylmuramoyl-L-alanine amidase [Clostridium aestuarii]
MRKIKAALLIVSVVMIFSACGNKEASNKNMKLVTGPKNIETAGKMQENDKEKKESINETKQENTKKQNSDEVDKPIEKKEVKVSKEVKKPKSSKTSASSKKSVKKEIPNIDYKLKNKIIVLDPGHASKPILDKEPMAPNSSKLKYKQTGGAEGVATKAPEYLVNMQIALKLRKELEQKGYTVIMTKTDNDKPMSNTARAKVGNEAHAGLVIRIHADSAENKSAKGATMLVPANNEYAKDFYYQSRLFGKVILNTLTNQVGMRNRGIVERDDITGFNWSTVPVVLIETGFMSNPEEDKFLSDSSYQQKIAKAITDGIIALTSNDEVENKSAEIDKNNEEAIENNEIGTELQNKQVDNESEEKAKENLQNTQSDVEQEN